jgi:hypothetical protein
MRTVYEERTGEANEINRKLLRGDARICGPSKFGTAWKALFPPPFKPAEELASRVGCSVRTAEYELSGDHHPSAQSIRALVDEVVPQWK